MRKTYIVSLSLVTFIALMTCCNLHTENKEKIAAAHHLVDSFNSLSRPQQILTCAGCHAKEYENEMKGPHANAVRMLRKHLEYTGSSHYTDKDYQDYLIGENSNTCYACHASENQYEAMFKKITDNIDSFRLYQTDHSSRRPPMRKAVKDDFLTGVDCLSCHYDGERVVTNKSFKALSDSSSPAYCNPRGSSLFSKSNACTTCHHDEYKGIVKIAGVQTTDCVSCHQQYDSKGKGTHYIYWRHDDADHDKPAKLKVMNDITARYDANAHKVVVEWQNKTMPHPLSLFIEMIAFLEVSDQNGKVLAKKEIRLNRREEYNINVKRRGYKAFGGISGYNLPLDGSAIRDTLSNVAATKGSKLQLKIEGAEKGQYWLPDRTMEKSYYRIIEL